MIEIVPDGPLPEASLRDFETKHQLSLPEDYRSWLLRHGGGEAAADYRVDNGVVSEFLGLGTEAVDYDLDSVRSQPAGFAAWVPTDFLIIAPGSGGDLCLRLSEPGRGGVWRADYDLADEVLGARGADLTQSGELPEMMRELASTFNGFLIQFPR